MTEKCVFCVCLHISNISHKGILHARSHLMRESLLYYFNFLAKRQRLHPMPTTFQACKVCCISSGIFSSEKIPHKSDHFCNLFSDAFAASRKGLHKNVSKNATETFFDNVLQHYLRCFVIFVNIFGTVLLFGYPLLGGSEHRFGSGVPKLRP